MRLLKLAFFITILSITTQVFAHGWQITPKSRTEYLVNINKKDLIGYNPQQIASNLTGNFSGGDYQTIKNFPGGGPRAYFRQYHVQHGLSENICANGTNYTALLNPIPESYVESYVEKYIENGVESERIIESVVYLQTQISDPSNVEFKWVYTATHVPSTMFVFVTNYDSTKPFKNNPTWSDLNYVADCDTFGISQPEQTWYCSLENSDRGKLALSGHQTIVTVWQRQDPAGENFISCADVEFVHNRLHASKQEKTWVKIGATNLASQFDTPVVPNETIKFDIFKNQILVKEFTIPITAQNQKNWEDILAHEVNQYITKTGSYIKIGILTANKQTVNYDAKSANANQVFVNTKIVNPHQYNYKLTKTGTVSATDRWSVVGIPLNDWSILTSAKSGDKLSLTFGHDGKDIEKVEVVLCHGAIEQQVADAINNHIFSNDIHVKVDNVDGVYHVNVLKHQNDTSLWNYVIRK